MTASSWAKAPRCSCSRKPSSAAARRHRRTRSCAATRPRSDAYHMVQPRPDGLQAARAARLAMADGSLKAADVDYVNAHASSTPLGDAAEAIASARHSVRAPQSVPVSGTKAYYGHPLGASGAIEAAICSLAIRRGWAPGTVNLTRRIRPCWTASRPARRALVGRHPDRALDIVRIWRAERRARLLAATRRMTQRGGAESVPSTITYDELLALVRRFEGRTLETVSGKRFRVGLYRDCAVFTLNRADTHRVTAAPPRNGSSCATTPPAAFGPVTTRRSRATPRTTWRCSARLRDLQPTRPLAWTSRPVAAPTSIKGTAARGHRNSTSE